MMTFEPSIILRIAAEMTGWLLMGGCLLLGARLLLKHLLNAGKAAWKETQIFQEPSE